MRPPSSECLLTLAREVGSTQSQMRRMRLQTERALGGGSKAGAGGRLEEHDEAAATAIFHTSHCCRNLKDISIECLSSLLRRSKEQTRNAGSNSSDESLPIRVPNQTKELRVEVSEGRGAVYRSSSKAKLCSKVNSTHAKLVRDITLGRGG